MQDYQQFSVNSLSSLSIESDLLQLDHLVYIYMLSTKTLYFLNWFLFISICSSLICVALVALSSTLFLFESSSSLFFGFTFINLALEEFILKESFTAESVLSSEKEIDGVLLLFYISVILSDFNSYKW